jgi:hypothetical protein
VAAEHAALEALFDQAVSLSATERARFLGRTCSDDPEARAELESLLVVADQAEPFFDSLARAVTSLSPWARETALEQEPGPDPRIGSSIRQYRIEGKLGAGGMGIVYRALDTRLGRTVALKFLPPYLSAEDVAKERFLVEARAAAAVDHPNVCTVHEIGEDEDGQLFIAMAYYPGETRARR